jgi:hypothetical protein
MIADLLCPVNQGSGLVAMASGPLLIFCSENSPVMMTGSSSGANDHNGKNAGKKRCVKKVPEASSIKKGVVIITTPYGSI